MSRFSSGVFRLLYSLFSSSSSTLRSRLSSNEVSLPHLLMFSRVRSIAERRDALVFIDVAPLEIVEC